MAEDISNPLLAGSRLASRKYGPKTSRTQNPRNLLALVTLNFDPACFHRSAGAAGFLHLRCKFLLFGQTDPDEATDLGDGLAAPSCL